MSYQHQSRRILPPGASRKRTDRDLWYTSKPRLADKPSLEAEESIGSSNKLLAGYMAFEYLTAGTLFGQKFDPGRAEAVPLAAGGWAEPKRSKPAMEPAVKRSYCEVACLLKAEGVHIPGIVNPTQLARWIQM